MSHIRLEGGDDVAVPLLAQGDPTREDEERQDDDAEGRVERRSLEGLDVGGRQQVGVDIVSHGGRDGDESDDGVRESTSDLVQHGSHREGDGFVALAGLELSVLNRVRDREDRGHLDARGRQVEEHQRDEDDREVRGEEDEQDVGDGHERHTAEVEVAARHAAVDRRVQGRHNQADNEGDDADEGVVVGKAQHELEEVDHEARGRNIRDRVEDVGQGDPQELVVASDGLEGLQGVGLVARIAQDAFFLTGAEGDGQAGDDAEDRDDRAKAGPAFLALRASSGEAAEEGDHGDDNRGDAVVADRTGEGTQGGVDASLLRGGGQGGNHAPVGDVAQRVEDVEHHENDDEDDDENALVDVDQAKESGEDREEQDR